MGLSPFNKCMSAPNNPVAIAPNFAETGVSPFARLRPDEAGWELAQLLVDGK